MLFFERLHFRFAALLGTELALPAFGHCKDKPNRLGTVCELPVQQELGVPVENYYGIMFDRKLCDFLCSEHRTVCNKIPCKIS